MRWKGNDPTDPVGEFAEPRGWPLPPTATEDIVDAIEQAQAISDIMSEYRKSTMDRLLGDTHNGLRHREIEPDTNCIVCGEPGKRRRTGAYVCRQCFKHCKNAGGAW